MFNVGCTRSVQVLATVENSQITQDDVTFKEKILKIYYPEYAGDLHQAALQQLVNANIDAQILKNNGHEMNDEVLKKEAARIKQSSQKPEMLSQIQKIFEGDEASYLKNYVLPVYVERVIFYEFFLHDKKIQADSLAAAEEFLKLMLTQKKSFEKIIKRKSEYKNLKVFHFTVSASDGIVLDASKSPLQNKINPNVPVVNSPTNSETSSVVNQFLNQHDSEEGLIWVNHIVMKTKPGSVFDQVIDQNEIWWVVQYLGPDKNKKYRFKGVALPKADYTKWLNTEKQKIKAVYNHY